MGFSNSIITYVFEKPGFLAQRKGDIEGRFKYTVV